MGETRPPHADGSKPSATNDDRSMHILLVEDQIMFRGAVKRELAERYPHATFTEVGLVSELDRLEPSTFDIAIVDLELPDGNALGWISRAVESSNPIPVLILSSVDPRHEVLVYRAAQAGVAGFVHKNEELPVLLNAVQTVLAGGMFYSPLVHQMRRSQSRPDFFNKILTEREQEMLGYIGEGMTNEEIAQIMGLKQASVIDYRKRLMAKLDKHTATDLMKYAIDMGFTKL